MRIVSIACIALAGACAHGPRFRCPTRGAPDWAEYTSKHFVVDTDARRDRAAALIEKLERLRELELLAMVGEPVETAGRLRVLAFASESDFKDMAGEGVAGYYTRDGYARPTLVFSIAALGASPETLAHELAHHLSFYLYPAQPRWFTEGLAIFVQTVALKAETPDSPIGSHLRRVTPPATAGSVPEVFMRSVQSPGAAVPAAELFAWSGRVSNDSPGRFHLWSWLLYHWLWNERGRQLTELQKRLADGDAPDDAWVAAFPEFDPRDPRNLDRLDGELDTYRKKGRFAAFAIRAEADARFTEAAVSPAAAHLLALERRRSWPEAAAERQAFVRAQLDEAVREDPTNPAAAIWRALAEGNASMDLRRRAAEAAPSDWTGWYLLATAADAPTEKEAALRKAVALDPDVPAAQNALAWLLVKSDRAAEALPHANRAVDLAPWCASCLDTLAEVAARLGKCPEAVRLARRASWTASNAGGDAQPSPERQFRDGRTADIERRCGAGAVPAASGGR